MSSLGVAGAAWLAPVRGRFADPLRARLERHFGGDTVDEASLDNLRRCDDYEWVRSLSWLLWALDVDNAGLLLATRDEAKNAEVMALWCDFEREPGELTMSARMAEALQTEWGTTSGSCMRLSSIRGIGLWTWRWP